MVAQCLHINVLLVMYSMYSNVLCISVHIAALVLCVQYFHKEPTVTAQESPVNSLQCEPCHLAAAIGACMRNTHTTCKLD